MDALAIHAAMLFALLGHPSYDVRKSVQSVPMCVVEIGLAHPDAEIRFRCGRFKEDLDRRAAVAKIIAEHGRIPWIDALPPSYPDREAIIKRYVAIANETPPIPGEKFYAWRLATELFLLDEFVPRDAFSILRRMPADAWWNGTSWILYQGDLIITLEVPKP